ncbi:hypothetical protein [Dactylosporangium matsuzakiense]|uniref:Uncharacterized protein n=1 Tax=Dactylosporangium matsuzakiense TaxID=53360 RepID=A0A9W6KQL8_9ACTN|nr:hypothetical protein [Dactylosporangium matsuzakiense]UWZ43888.1 hypothetical protein Dmats_41805 [Dactylosporangium matsuzakiense]GLL06317.1 hypothetical protein GCM10017581_080660 [Dactylosporangium matsuzakiense]
MRSNPLVPAAAVLLPQTSRLLGRGWQLWSTPTLEFWCYYRPDDAVEVVDSWEGLWACEPIARLLRGAMARLADPELYDLDGLYNQPDHDAGVRAEMLRLHIRDFEVRALTPKQVFRATRTELIDGLGSGDPGSVLYYLTLQEMWLLRMRNMGWSIERLAQATGVQQIVLSRIVTEAGQEERRSRAHGRAARLRRVARLKRVLERDGRWSDDTYRAELTRVLHRAGLGYDDLPKDVAYLN